MATGAKAQELEALKLFTGLDCLDGSWKTFKDLSSFNPSTFYDQDESRSDDEICLSFLDNHELTIYRVNNV